MSLIAVQCCRVVSLVDASPDPHLAFFAGLTMAAVAVIPIVLEHRGTNIVATKPNNSTTAKKARWHLNESTRRLQVLAWHSSTRLRFYNAIWCETWTPAAKWLILANEWTLFSWGNCRMQFGDCRYCLLARGWRYFWTLLQCWPKQIHCCLARLNFISLPYSMPWIGVDWQVIWGVFRLPWHAHQWRSRHLAISQTAKYLWLSTNLPHVSSWHFRLF